MNPQIITIVLTGGGSGGHITPLLSLARALKAAEPRCRIVYIGLKGDKLEGLQGDYQVFDQVRTVPAGKFRRYHGESFLAHLIDIQTILLNFRDLFRVIGGIFAARRLLKAVKPDVVFSKGGFVAVPVGIAAHWQHIPIITHDSDASAGLANKLIGRWASLHATGMPSGHYPYPKSSIRFTGIPLDERVKPVSKSLQAEYKQKLGISPDQPVLLIGGAGLGARDVNNLVVQIVAELLTELPGLHIFHISGNDHLKDLKERYEALSPAQHQRVTALGFTPNFYLYTGAADLVITRSGATTIAELAVQQKAVLLIPAAFLPGGHQLENSKVLAAEGAAVVLPNDVSPAELQGVVGELLSDPDRRAELAKKLSAHARPDAANELAKLVLEAAGQGRTG